MNSDLQLDNLKAEENGFITIPEAVCGEYPDPRTDDGGCYYAGEFGKGKPIKSLDADKFWKFVIRNPQYKNLMIPKDVKIWPTSLMPNACLLNILIHPTLKYMQGSFWGCIQFEQNKGGKIYYTGTEEEWNQLCHTKGMLNNDYTDYREIVSFVNPETFRLPEIDYKDCSVRYCAWTGTVTVPISYEDANHVIKPINEIGMLSFAYNDGVTKVIIPPEIKTVSQEAFRGCYNLEEVIFLESEQSIDICMGAFCDCQKLSRIYFGRKANMEEYAFLKSEPENCCEIKIETSEKIDYREFANEAAFKYIEKEE